MEYRRMGRSGLQLSLLSYGSWVTFHKQVDEKKGDELMGLAYDNGINFFDNAEVYARGESEKLMGRILKNKKWDRTSYTISSKAFFGWHGPDNKPNQTGLSRKHLIEACNEALQRMQLDYIDLFFCHRPDPNVPMEEVVWAMNILIQQGKVLYWGTSEWSGAEVMAAHEAAMKNNLIGPAVEQPEYNLFNRHKLENDFLPLFNDEIGIGTTIWSPLASGLLTGKYNNGVPDGSRITIPGFDWLKERVMVEEKIEKVRRLKPVADQLGTSLATFSIAWCIRNPHVTTAILGATSSTQLKQNLEALELYPKLTPEVLQEVDDIMKTTPGVPQV
jgi:voltage-dependent potassium channel beta subunit